MHLIAFGMETELEERKEAAAEWGRSDQSCRPVLLPGMLPENFLAYLHGTECNKASPPVLFINIIIMKE